MRVESDPLIQATKTMVAALVTVCDPGDNLGSLAAIEERVSKLPNWL
jgi:hypothetical protein